MAGDRQRVSARSRRHRVSPRTSQLVGAAGFVAAACMPIVLWHRPIAMVASDFRLELEYLITGWTAYTLIGLGLLFFVPVVVSIGRSPESRLYPRSRSAYVGWGLSLYLLGVALATQIAQIARGPAAP